MEIPPGVRGTRWHLAWQRTRVESRWRPEPWPPGATSHGYLLRPATTPHRGYYLFLLCLAYFTMAEKQKERDVPASGGGARTWQSPSLQACRRTGGLATMLSLLTGGRIEISAEGAQRRSSDGRSIACSSRGAAVVAQAPSPGRTRGLGG
jgi:hypothetical protein